MAQQPAVRRSEGGNTLTVGAGGKLVVEEGAEVSGLDSGPSNVAADDITDASDVGKGVLTAATAAAARTAIGAGTSSVALPPTATAAELEAGTVTATRLISPRLLADEIDRRIAAASGT